MTMDMKQKSYSDTAKKIYLSKDPAATIERRDSNKAHLKSSPLPSDSEPSLFSRVQRPKAVSCHVYLQILLSDQKLHVESRSHDGKGK